MPPKKNKLIKGQKTLASLWGRMRGKPPSVPDARAPPSSTNERPPPPSSTNERPPPSSTNERTFTINTNRSRKMPSKRTERTKKFFNAVGIPTVVMDSIKLEKKGFTQMMVDDSKQDEDWDSFGKEHIRPLLERYDVRSYTQLSDKMARFCSHYESAKTTYGTYIVGSDDEFYSWCQGSDFCEAVWSLYSAGIGFPNRTFYDLYHKRKQRRASLLRQVKYQVNKWLSDLFLSDLQARCQKFEQVIPLMKEYLDIMYKGVELPTDSANKFLSSLDRCLVLAFAKLNRELGNRKTESGLQMFDKYVKLAFLLAYDELMGQDNWTNQIQEQATEIHARKKLTQRTLKSIKRQSWIEEQIATRRELYKDLVGLPSDPSMLYEPNPTTGAHQDYINWCTVNRETDSGDSFIKFRRVTNQSLPWASHAVPFAPRHHWLDKEDSTSAPRDYVPPPDPAPEPKLALEDSTPAFTPIVYPPTGLPEEILNLIVNSHRGDPDQWSIYAWFNVFVEGALRHINNSKNRHLDRGFDFMLVLVAPGSKGWLQLLQDRLGPRIPFRRKYYRKTPGKVEGHVVFHFACPPGSNDYTCIKMWGADGMLDKVPDVSHFLRLIKLIQSDKNHRPDFFSAPPHLKSCHFQNKSNPPPIVIPGVGQSGELEDVMIDWEPEEGAPEARAPRNRSARSQTYDLTHDDDVEEEDRKPSATSSTSEARAPGNRTARSHTYDLTHDDDDDGDRKPAARDLTASASNPGQEVIEVMDDEEDMGYVPAQPNQPVPAAASASGPGQGNEDGNDTSVESNAISLHNSFPEWQIDDIRAILLQNGNDKKAFMEFVEVEQRVEDEDGVEPRVEEEDGFIVGSLYTARTSAFRPVDNEVPAPKLDSRVSMGEPQAMMPSRDNDNDNDVDEGLANEMGSKMSVSTKSGSSGDKKSTATYATPQDGNKRQAKKSPNRPLFIGSTVGEQQPTIVEKSSIKNRHQRRVHHKGQYSNDSEEDQDGSPDYAEGED